MDLIEKMRARQETEAVTAARTYVAILLRLGDPRPGDEDQLAECLRILGRTTDDIAGDAELIGQAESARVQIASMPSDDPGPEKLSRAAERSVDSWFEMESEKLRAERDRRLAEIAAEYAPALKRMHEGRSAKATLNGLYARLVEVLGATAVAALGLKV